jgi:hypothetical protein
MFQGEVSLSCRRRQHDQKVAMEITGDIHEYTTLHGPREEAGVAYLEGRLIFDFNEHFIELGTPEHARSFSFMTFGITVLMLCLPAIGLLMGATLSNEGLVTSDFVFFGCLSVITTPCFGILWYVHLRGFFFTALTARYRFNRTTGKVYVLRPRQFGGNAVLDWHRVKAHVNWTAPLDLKPGYQHDVRQRDARQSAGGGYMMRRGLVLYWPPLDPEDPTRQGEDILWVGQWLCGQPLWSYLRTFMEEGMDAVPAPQPDEYRRKGRSSMWQHLWEGQLDSYVRGAKLQGHPNPRSAIGVGLYFREVPFLIFNSMAQWLCWWPTFPEEWNSDCGRKRRENGIGPEEPLRWTAQ